MLESRKDREARGQNGGFTPNNGNASAQNTNNFQPNNGAAPANNNSTQNNDTPDPFAGSGDTIDISDDDLPF